jgi:hypothetical protein
LIVHSGPVNEQLRRFDSFSIDLDDNGVVDFRASNNTQTGFTSQYYQTTNYWRADIAGLNGQVAIQPNGGYGYVDQFFLSETIDNNRAFGNFPTLVGYRLVTTSFGIGREGEYFGEFAANGFAGVRFYAGGQNHFGWIQLNINDFDRSYTVVDWAYETVPDTPILAGVTMSDVDQLDGDYNDDGLVNAADYVAWRNNEGTNNGLPNDPHGGTIGDDQYNTWRDNFGQSAGSGSSAAIPEPTTVSLGMLALGTAGIAALRRRKNEPPRRQVRQEC